MQPDPDQLVDPIHQGNAVHLRLPVGIPQPLRFVVQDAAGCGHADRLHLVEERVVGGVLQRQQLATRRAPYSVSMPASSATMAGSAE